MSNSQIRRPGRQYHKRGTNWVRAKIPMRPAVRCLISGSMTGGIGYDPQTKCIKPDVITIFPSRTKARKALWHIIQSPNSYPQFYEIIREPYPQFYKTTAKTIVRGAHEEFAK